MRFKIGLLVILSLLFTGSFASAQNINLQWNRWDAAITVTGDNSPMAISEVQEIQVLDGTVNGGQRYWTTPVELQNVQVVLSGERSARQLTQGNGTTNGTYSLSQSGNNYVLSYRLPSPQARGSTFAIQIDYRANSPTTGMVDWKVVPADHEFPVQSSVVKIRFPSGQGPDASLVRASQTSAQISIQGNDYTIQSASPIPANTSFAIQVPFGAGVGVAGANDPINPNNNGNTDNSGAPFAPDPLPSGQSTSFGLPSFGTICGILCIVGILVLLGGGGLLRGLLGGLFGGGSRGYTDGSPGGGVFPGTSNTGGGGSFFGSGGSAGRGFRQSGDQNRNVGRVGDDKDSGGGASFN
jgi:hypothetical protein